jgi:hypothetical protein
MSSRTWSTEPKNAAGSFPFGLSVTYRFPRTIILWLVNPKLSYPVTPDGSLPEEYKYTLDPLDTLTFAVAHTSTIKLGTSVLDMPGVPAGTAEDGEGISP